jgi:hypothetical protein
MWEPRRLTTLWAFTACYRDSFTFFSNPGRGKIFLFFTMSRPALRPTHPPIQWVPGALSPGAKRPGRKADHSPPSSAEVKNGGAIPSFPYMSSCLYSEGSCSKECMHGFLGLPMTSREYQDGSQVPSCCYMLLMQPFRYKFI